MNTPKTSSKVKSTDNQMKATDCHLRKRLDQQKSKSKEQIFQVVYY